MGLKNKPIAAMSLVLAACAVFADGTDDARKLKDEALEVLKANASRLATPEQYAGCILKLEQAQALLEKAGDSGSALAQEVSATLFWARRFSDMKVLAALDKLRGGKAAPPPPPPARKAEPAKPASPDEPELPPPVLAEAKKAFLAAQTYADGHRGDDYAVALRWFQMAAENPGNDYALKALDLAREAQKRFAARSGAVEEALPDTPEMKLVKDADALLLAGNYETAFPLYQSSLKLKDTVVAHRRLGHACFKRAQQLKDDFLPKFEAVEEKVRAAFKDAFVEVRMLSGRRKKFNPNYPPLVAAKREEAELLKQANVAIAFYDKAYEQFQAVLRAAPKGKDFDAAGHTALCLTVKGEPNSRARGRTLLLSFLGEYTPTNDLERSLYEFCKTDLERLKRGG